MNPNCHCWMCQRDIPVATSDVGLPGGSVLTRGMTQMFLCPRCGNKRCPHATDHREACTGSNEPGQMGSQYGVWPNPNRPLLDFLEGRDPDQSE